MKKKTVIVINETGLHARPASDFTLKAKSFKSQIVIRVIREQETEPINAKSVMKILASSIKKGETMEITAEGPDEQEAVEALSALIQSGFGEAF